MKQALTAMFSFGASGLSLKDGRVKLSWGRPWYALPTWSDEWGPRTEMVRLYHAMMPNGELLKIIQVGTRHKKQFALFLDDESDTL